MSNRILVNQVAEVLLRNGFVDVAATSESVARVIAGEPDLVSRLPVIQDAISRDLAFRSGKSRRHIAELLAAQLRTTGSKVSIDVASVPEAVVLVATDLEFSHVAQQLTQTVEALDGNGNWLAFGRTPGGHLTALVKTGQGNVASAAVATSVLQANRPKVAVFSGIAGGLWDQSIGTVVISSNVHDYESAEDGTERRSRAKSQPVHHALLQVSSAVARTGVPGVKSVEVRPIVSGEKLVTDTSNETSAWIRTVASDAAVVEMEGLGMVSASNSLGIPAIVIRGVSDHRGDKSGEADRANQPIAAEAAARTAMAVIDKFLL